MGGRESPPPQLPSQFCFAHEMAHHLTYIGFKRTRETQETKTCPVWDSCPAPGCVSTSNWDNSAWEGGRCALLPAGLRRWRLDQEQGVTLGSAPRWRPETTFALFARLHSNLSSAVKALCTIEGEASHFWSEAARFGPSFPKGQLDQEC